MQRTAPLRATESRRPRLAALVIFALLSSLAFLQPSLAAAALPHSPLAAPAQLRAAATLPVPTGLSVRADDRVATLQWDDNQKSPLSELAPNVMGYRITWGPADQPSANTRMSEQRIVQLQPLTNGAPYVATVQSVDSYGNVSDMSAPIRFTGNPARVDALRARMTGFFDDFNLPEGAADELKWNTAYSLCNSAWSNTFFINKQFHAHNTIYTGNCDRGQQVNRPRAALDLSDNGTRTIVFDFDGVFRRNHWYLDLTPRLLDLSGPTNYEPGTLRFTQGGNVLAISTFDANGAEVVLKETDWSPYPPLDWAGLPLVSNVRRNWEIRLSKTSAEIRIDGKLVLATDPGTLRLDHERYHPLWTTFSYNTPKANQPLVFAHWDNFGFDAPAGKGPDSETHNYKLVNSGTDFIDVRSWNKSSPATVRLNIPDSVAGARARRLMFTLQMKGNDAYSWAATDKVTINGSSFPLPRPSLGGAPLAVDSIRPYSAVIALPDGVLKQGINTLVFAADSSGIHNIHAELDFAAGSAPAYTPPSEAASGPVILAMPAVGPNLVITDIGATKVDRYAESYAGFNPGASGIVPVTVEVKNGTALEATGANTGVAMLELLVDRRVVMRQPRVLQSPAPAARYTFNLDTRKLADGPHELFVRAFSPTCTPSIPDYHAAWSLGNTGLYFPLRFTVQNGGGAQASLAASAAYRVSLPLVALGAGSVSGGLDCAEVAGLLDAQPSGQTPPAGPLGQAAPAADLRREGDNAAAAPYGWRFLCE